MAVQDSESNEGNQRQAKRREQIRQIACQL
jgi:hypothetical protein